MANNKKHIDQFFRDQLADFQIPGGDAEFAAILKGIAEKKRKKRLFWLIIGLFLIIASLLGGFILMKPLADGEVSANKMTQKTELEETPKGNLDLSTESSRQETSRELTDISDLDEVKTQYITSPKRIRSEIEMPSRKSKEFASNNQSPVFQSDGSIISDERIPTIHVLDSAPINQTPIVSDAEKDSDKIVNGYDSSASKIIDPIEIIKKDSATDTDLPAIPMAKDSTIPPRKTKLLNYYAGVSTGLAKARFNANAPKLGSVNYQNWKENEKGVWSNSYGVDLGIKVNQLTAETGLNSSVLKFENSDFKLQVFDSFPVRNPLGDTIDWIYKNYRDTSFFAPVSSTYKTLSIPIRMGYELELNPKLGLSALAAIQFNKQTQQTGNSIDQNTHLRPASGLPLRNWTNDLQVGLGCYYQVAEHWRIHARTFYNQSGGIYLKTADLDVRMQSFSFNFILRYEINP